MDINREKNLINILVEKRFITKRELSEAIERHKNVGGSIIESLLFLDFLDYKKLGRALSLLFQVPYINLEHIKITPEILEKIPLDFAEKYHLFPAGFIENKKALVVAMEDPSDQNILEKMRRFLEVDELRIGVAYSTEIERAINRYYKGLDLPELKKEIQLPKDFKIIEESDKERTTGWDLKDLVGKKKDRKVLLIEPDHEIRNPILSIMKKEGYVIEAVVDDSSAIELLGKKRFDLVLKRKKSGKGAFLYEKELKINLIKEFNKAKQKSYYLTHPNLLTEAFKILDESKSIIEYSPTASLLLSYSAIEVSLKAGIITPIINGLMNNEKLAEIIVDFSIKQAGLGKLKKILTNIIYEKTFFNFNVFKRNNASKTLWEEIKEINKIRNEIAHKAKKSSFQKAKLSINIAETILLELIPLILNKLKLNLDIEKTIIVEK